MDNDFSFIAHVRSICKGCFRNFTFRRYLTNKSAFLVANALLSSRLDYCNSLFRSLSSSNMCRLQCVQNTLARIVTKHTKYANITPILKDLHWLPIHYRSIFKTAILVCKFLHAGNPKYFGSSLRLCNSKYNTRHGQPNIMFSRFLNLFHQSFPPRKNLLMLLLYGMICQMRSGTLLSLLHFAKNSNLTFLARLFLHRFFIPELFRGADLDRFNGS